METKNAWLTEKPCMTIFAIHVQVYPVPSAAVLWAQAKQGLLLVSHVHSVYFCPAAPFLQICVFLHSAHASKYFQRDKCLTMCHGLWICVGWRAYWKCWQFSYLPQFVISVGTSGVSIILDAYIHIHTCVGVYEYIYTYLYHVSFHLSVYITCFHSKPLCHSSLIAPNNTLGYKLLLTSFFWRGYRLRKTKWLPLPHFPSRSLLDLQDYMS